MQKITLKVVIFIVFSAFGGNAAADVIFAVHGGEERREEIDWIGITFGGHIDEFSTEAQVPDWLRNLVAKDKVGISLEITISQLDHDTFAKERYDYAFIPKLSYYLAKNFYVRGGLGVGYNELEKEDTPGNDLELGGRMFFAPEFNVGLEAHVGSTKPYLELTYTHRSNLGLGDTDDNQSLNFFLLNLGIRF